MSIIASMVLGHWYLGPLLKCAVCLRGRFFPQPCMEPYPTSAVCPINASGTPLSRWPFWMRHRHPSLKSRVAFGVCARLLRFNIPDSFPSERARQQSASEEMVSLDGIEGSLLQSPS